MLCSDCTIASVKLLELVPAPALASRQRSFNNACFDFGQGFTLGLLACGRVDTATWLVAVGRGTRDLKLRKGLHLIISESVNFKTELH